MKIGITSIQKNRGRYILEWIAFHMAVGFNSFYIYNHGDDDVQKKILIKLAQKFPKQIFPHQVSNDVDRPQISAYQHSWLAHKNDCDAMAFIDGDEFLFSPEGHLPDELSRFFYNPVSALGVYWMIYGSSGHIEEPNGLIIENFKRHSRLDFFKNRHIKTILRGGEDASINHSHLFSTPRGTYDEINRLIVDPIMRELMPSVGKFRINHYVIQSYNYFLEFKKNSGQADLPREYTSPRPNSFFIEHDKNDCDDGTIYNQIINTKLNLLMLLKSLND